MSKVTIRGEIHKIGEARTAGNSEVKEIIIHRKYHDPDTGELRGEDFFPVQIWEQNWDEFKKCVEHSGKVEMSGFVNGRRTVKDGSASYFCNIVAKSFKNI